MSCRFSISLLLSPAIRYTVFSPVNPNSPSSRRAQSNSQCPPTEFPLEEITEKIISCAMAVHSALGPGLMEGLYEEALIHEFGLHGIKCDRQKKITLNYKGKQIEEHRFDGELG